jgi:hypothetical protein
MKKADLLIGFWHLFSSPNPFFNLKKSDKNTIKLVKELDDCGYLSLGKIISDNDLNRVKNALDKIVEEGKSNYSESNYYHLIPDPMLIEELFNLSNLSEVIQVAEMYFKRKVFLADVDVRRIPPVSQKEVSSFGLSSSNWHRDTRGRQLKLMIYLTDVSEKDSNFSFYPKTHKKVTYGFDKSRFDENIFESEPIEWYGKAGEAMIFDTNIVHRLRRKALGNVRDSITFYYTPGQHLRKIKFNDDLILTKDYKFFKGSPFWSKRIKG